MKCTVYHSMKCAKNKNQLRKRSFCCLWKGKIKMKFKIYLMLLKISQKIKAAIIRSWAVKKETIWKSKKRSSHIRERINKKQWSWRWWWNSWNKKCLVCVAVVYWFGSKRQKKKLFFVFLGKQSSVSNVAFYSREVDSSKNERQ